MAPKGKSGAKAKAKSRSKAPPVRRQNPKAPPPQKKVAPATGKKQAREQKEVEKVIDRRLDRRDSEEKRDRAIDNKLANYDQAMIKTRRRADGKSIDEVVQAELRRLKPLNKYISTQFWTQLHVDFQLGAPLFNNLPEIEEDADPDPELLEALAIAHDPSRAVRSAEAFESFLRHSPPVDRTTLLVMIEQSREGPVISRNQSHAMFMVILGHIGAHALHNTLPDVWKAIEEPMEEILLQQAREVLADGLSRPFIIEGYGQHLQCFIDLEAMSRAQKASEEEDSQLPQDDLVSVTASKVGVELFKCEVGIMRYQLFVRKCDERVEALEYHDYEEAELTGFKTLMNQEVKHLQHFGFKMYDKKDCQHRFLLRPVSIKITSFPDDYWWRCLARMKSLGVSNGKLTRTPWEQVLFGETGTIGDLPTQVKVPMNLLAKNENARQALLDLMPKNIQLTFSEMITNVKKHEATLLGLCKDFSHEIASLTQQAEKVGLQRLADVLLDKMPKDMQSEVLVQVVVTHLKQVMAGSVYACLGPQNTKEIDDISSFLSMVNEGSGPKEMVTSNRQPLLRQVVERASFFYQLRVKNNAGGAEVFPSKVIAGVEAASHDLKSFDEAVASGGDFAPQVARLRRFAWLISKEDHARLDEAVKDKIKRRRTELMAPLALTDAEAKGPAGSPASLKKMTCVKSATDAAGEEDIFGSFSKGGSSSSSSMPKALKGKAAGPSPSKGDYKQSLQALFKKKTA